jgi:hypothetical protein
MKRLKKKNANTELIAYCSIDQNFYAYPRSYPQANNVFLEKPSSSSVTSDFSSAPDTILFERGQEFENAKLETSYFQPVVH